jgi:hypothetical protein
VREVAPSKLDFIDTVHNDEAMKILAFNTLLCHLGTFGGEEFCEKD